LDVRLPLARVVTISREKQHEFYAVKYEKIPKFCGFCGLFWHIHTECGSGEHDETTLKRGDFIKADFETWRNRYSNGFRGGYGRGRGIDPYGRGRGMRGREANISWRFSALHNSEKGNDNELQDTGTSPVKNDDVMQDADNTGMGAKRGLEFNSDHVLDLPVIAGKNGAPNILPTDTNPATTVIGDGLVKDRRKRSKKDGTNSNFVGSADSSKGYVRSQ
jgi:hypothetical protein